MLDDRMICRCWLLARGDQRAQGPEPLVTVTWAIPASLIDMRWSLEPPATKARELRTRYDGNINMERATTSCIVLGLTKVTQHIGCW